MDSARKTSSRKYKMYKRTSHTYGFVVVLPLHLSLLVSPRERVFVTDDAVLFSWAELNGKMCSANRGTSVDRKTLVLPPTAYGHKSGSRSWSFSRILDSRPIHRNDFDE
uniref:Uncharacterized protein n=1 Tax=Parascaris equorum TaxID=6256 RepID=A0A914RAB8_PAREQ